MLRDTDLSLRRRAPLTRAAALVAVLICGLGAVGLRGPGSSPLAAAQEAGAPSASLPAAEPGGGFDFQYVPESAVAIWGIRPAALLADPRLAEARKALRDVSLPGFQFTVPIPEVEQALYLHIRVPDRERPFRFIGILRATQPQRFEEFIRRTHPETHVEVIDGQTYYIPGNFSRRGAVCIRPDEYTLIHGEGYNDWDEAYSSAKKGMPGFLPQEVWNEFRDAYAVGAVRAPEFLPLTERARNHRRMRAFPEFAPFWEDSQWGIVGLRWNEEGFRLDGMIQGNDAPSAQRVDETWVAAKTLLANFIRQNEPLSGFPFTATAAIRETMGSSRGVIEQTIRQTRTQQDGSVVRATCALKAGDDVLASTFVIACRLREALLRAESANNLAHINLAMHNYHDLHKHFPPPILYSETGVPYSWRVALLPVMGHEAIYEKYRFDEPWNSPSNLQLAATMVPEYVSPTEPHSTHTAYLALTGPATAFEPGPGTAFRDIADGASNTIVLVEADRAIPWTKPEDIPYDAAQPMPELGGFFQGGFHAAMGDGSVRFFSDRIAPDLLRALITKSGGETVDRDRVLQASGGAP